MLLAQRLLAIKDGMDRVEKEVNFLSLTDHFGSIVIYFWSETPEFLREKTLKS